MAEKTKIFLDSGNPQETREILKSLDFLDGQTTNPSLIAKSPKIDEVLKRGEKVSLDEAYKLYKEIITEISQLLPQGSVSVEVCIDENTSVEKIITEAKELFSWIPNAHIKLPITAACLEAAEKLVKMGVRLNLTLCFSQEQAAAVYAATQGAYKGQVFISPFVGRIDDRGENGMDLIKNIVEMYKNGDGHVEVLTASVRNLNHFLEGLRLGSDIITVPFKVLTEWIAQEMPMPASLNPPIGGEGGSDENFVYNSVEFKPILYQEINLNQDWKNFNISHELTDVGIKKFIADWQSFIE